MSTPCPVLTQNTAQKISTEQHVALVSLIDEKLKEFNKSGILLPAPDSAPLMDVYEKTPFNLREYLISTARCNAQNAIEINSQLDKIDRVRKAAPSFDSSKVGIEVERLLPGSSIDKALYNAFWADSVLQKKNIDYKPLVEFRKNPSALEQQYPGLPEDKAREIKSDASQASAGATFWGNRAENQRRLEVKKLINEGELVKFNYQTKAVKFTAVSKVIKAQEYLILGEQIDNQIPLPKPLDVADIYLKQSKAKDPTVVQKWESSFNSIGVNRAWDRGLNILREEDTKKEYYLPTLVGIPTVGGLLAAGFRSLWSAPLSASLSGLGMSGSASAVTPVGLVAGAIGTVGYQYSGKVHTTQKNDIKAVLDPQLTATAAAATPEAKNIINIDGQIISVTKAAYANAGEIKKAGKLLQAQLGAQQTVLGAYVFQASELNVAVRAQAQAVRELIREQNNKK